ADGGITWTATPSGTDALLLRVAFPDVDNGWAVGQANDGTGVILVTSDGGDTWTLDIPESTSEPLWGVAFPDSRHGWLVGVSGTILRSF
ncbi:MAG: WD40/YVTN/BNR-like repeat-containing protein, partial [Limisphaerales bacterium]